MPDKSKCTGGNCTMKDNCYRYKPFMDVTPFSDNQPILWFIKPPYNEESNSCEMFIDNLHHHTIGH